MRPQPFTSRGALTYSLLWPNSSPELIPRLEAQASPTPCDDIMAREKLPLLDFIQSHQPVYPLLFRLRHPPVPYFIYRPIRGVLEAGIPQSVILLAALLVSLECGHDYAPRCEVGDHGLPEGVAGADGLVDEEAHVGDLAAEPVDDGLGL